jgi:hypothetical protein
MSATVSLFLSRVGIRSTRSALSVEVASGDLAVVSGQSTIGVPCALSWVNGETEIGSVQFVVLLYCTLRSLS